MLVPQRLRNVPLACITSWCPISLADPTGWLKPNNQGGCSCSLGLSSCLVPPVGREGVVSTQECTQCCLLLPEHCLEQGSAVVIALLRE